MAFATKATKLSEGYGIAEFETDVRKHFVEMLEACANGDPANKGIDTSLIAVSLINQVLDCWADCDYGEAQRRCGVVVRVSGLDLTVLLNRMVDNFGKRLQGKFVDLILSAEHGPLALGSQPCGGILPHLYILLHKNLFAKLHGLAYVPLNNDWWGLLTDQMVKDADFAWMTGWHDLTLCANPNCEGLLGRLDLMIAPTMAGDGAREDVKVRAATLVAKAAAEMLRRHRPDEDTCNCCDMPRDKTYGLVEEWLRRLHAEWPAVDPKTVYSHVVYKVMKSDKDCNDSKYWAPEIRRPRVAAMMEIFRGDFWKMFRLAGRPIVAMMLAERFALPKRGVGRDLYYMKRRYIMRLNRSISRLQDGFHRGRWRAHMRFAAAELEMQPPTAILPSGGVAYQETVQDFATRARAASPSTTP